VVSFRGRGGLIWCARDTTLALPACPAASTVPAGAVCNLMSMSGNALWCAAVVGLLVALDT